MSRLIREIDVQRILTKTELSGGNFTEAKIAVRDNIKTAYDVEAVVAELEELKDSAFTDEYTQFCFRQAIEAVKRGGRNE